MYNLIMKLKKEAPGDTARSTAADGESDGDAENSGEDEEIYEPEEEGELGDSDSGVGYESDAEDGATLASASSGKKRRHAGAVVGADSSESEDDAELARLRQQKRRGVKLSRLHALLDVPYSYSLARDEVSGCRDWGLRHWWRERVLTRRS